MKALAVSVLAFIIVALLGRVLFMVIPVSGVFTEFSTVAVDQCRAIASPPGPEDIQINHKTGIAYISASQRRGRTDGATDGIYTLDLANKNAALRRLEIASPADFRPHGISLLAEQGLLFAINHPNNGHAVEIFQIEGERLIHLETITSELFIEPNDIVAVGPRSFYLSNFNRAQGGIGLLLERYLGLPVTDIIYSDEGVLRIAASGLISANGVNVSKDGSKLYVAELLAQKINIFQRAIATGELGARKRISIGTSADNIDVAPDGDLYIAAHPNILAFAAHAEDESANSPSQIIRIDSSTQAQETIFMSINGEFNGSSVGAFWQGNLLLGSVHESQLMACAI